MHLFFSKRFLDFCFDKITTKEVEETFLAFGFDIENSFGLSPFNFCKIKERNIIFSNKFLYKVTSKKEIFYITSKEFVDHGTKVVFHNLQERDSFFLENKLFSKKVKITANFSSSEDLKISFLWKKKLDILIESELKKKIPFFFLQKDDIIFDLVIPFNRQPNFSPLKFLVFASRFLKKKFSDNMNFLNFLEKNFFISKIKKTDVLQSLENIPNNFFLLKAPSSFLEEKREFFFNKNKNFFFLARQLNINNIKCENKYFSILIGFCNWLFSLNINFKILDKKDIKLSSQKKYLAENSQLILFFVNQTTSSNKHLKFFNLSLKFLIFFIEKLFFSPKITSVSYSHFLKATKLEKDYFLPKSFNFYLHDLVNFVGKKITLLFMKKKLNQIGKNFLFFKNKIIKGRVFFLIQTSYLGDDYLNKEDLFEEIIIFLKINYFTEKAFSLSSPSSSDLINFSKGNSLEIWEISEKIKNYLISLNFFELKNFNLVNKNINRRYNIFNYSKLASLKNELNKHREEMRSSLLSSFFNDFCKNIASWQNNSNFFELEKIHLLGGFYHHLICFLRKDFLVNNFFPKKNFSVDLFFLKMLMRNIYSFFKINFSSLVWKPVYLKNEKYYIEVLNNKKEIITVLGFFYLKKNQKIFFIEFNLTKILQFCQIKPTYFKKIPLYSNTFINLTFLKEKKIFNWFYIQEVIRRNNNFVINSKIVDFYSLENGKEKIMLILTFNSFDQPLDKKLISLEVSKIKDYLLHNKLINYFVD